MISAFEWHGMPEGLGSDLDLSEALADADRAIDVLAVDILNGREVDVEEIVSLIVGRLLIKAISAKQKP